MLHVQGEKSAFLVILFLWCTPTPALKHWFSLIHPFSSIWCYQHACQLHYFSLRGNTDWPRCRREWETGTLIRLMAFISLSPVVWGARDAVWRRRLKGLGKLRGTEHSPNCSIASPPLTPLAAPGSCSTVTCRRWSTKGQQQLITGWELLIYITDKCINYKNDIEYAEYSNSIQYYRSWKRTDVQGKYQPENYIHILIYKWTGMSKIMNLGTVYNASDKEHYIKSRENGERGLIH